MTPDDKPPMPALPKTVRDMEAPPPWAVAMAEKFEAGVRGIRADVSVVSSSTEALRLQVQGIDFRVSGLESRAGNVSERVRDVSKSDMSQDAAIASVVTDVAALKTEVESLTASNVTQLAILKRLDNIAANPTVRRVAYVVGTAVVGYLTARGLK